MAVSPFTLGEMVVLYIMFMVKASKNTTEKLKKREKNGKYDASRSSSNQNHRRG
jgi:hypothetical protein